MDDNSRNIDEQLRQAYLATSYEVPHLGIKLQIGIENWHLKEFLIDNNVFSWAFISAFNPFSQPLPDQENEQRHTKLIDFVNKRQWVFAEGLGVPHSDDWIPEKSLFLLDISKKEAIHLGKIFEQNAIVFGHLGQAPELLFL